MSNYCDKVLIIKLGALGDIVQALGPIAAIRNYHQKAHITLLTSRLYEEFMLASGYVNTIWLDEKPHWTQLRTWIDFRQIFRAKKFNRVYDLQTSDRSCAYYHMLWPGPYPEWSGIVKGCSHRHLNPDRDNMHTIERQADQLLVAGISKIPQPNLSWGKSSHQKFAITHPMCLLVPGGSPHRLLKRWPAHCYTELANILSKLGVTPVLIGGSSEYETLKTISDTNQNICNLAGRTTLLDVLDLAHHSILAIGNDTGPMHLMSSAGCPSLVLFSSSSNPDLCAPRGPNTKIVQANDLTRLSVEDVIRKIQTVVPSLFNIAE